MPGKRSKKPRSRRIGGLSIAPGAGDLHHQHRRPPRQGVLSSFRAGYRVGDGVAVQDHRLTIAERDRCLIGLRQATSCSLRSQVDSNARVHRSRREVHRDRTVRLARSLCVLVAGWRRGEGVAPPSEGDGSACFCPLRAARGSPVVALSCAPRPGKCAPIETPPRGSWATAARARFLGLSAVMLLRLRSPPDCRGPRCRAVRIEARRRSSRSLWVRCICGTLTRI